MDQNELDQIFRNSLRDHKTALDKDQLWTAIATEQKKRGISYNLKPLSLLVLVGLVFTIGYKYTTVANQQSTVTVEEAVDMERSTIVSKKKTDSQNILKENDAKKTASSSVQEINSTSIFLADPITENLELDSKTSSKKQALANQNLSSNSQTSISYADNNSTLEKEAVTKSKQLAEANYTQVKTAKVVPTGTRAESSRSKTIISKTAYLAQLESSAPQLFTTLRNPKKNNGNIECYDHRKKVHPLYLEIYSSVDFVRNRFGQVSGENFSYLTERKATQTQLEGYRAGLRLKYLTRSGFYLKTGLEVGIVKERFDRVITEEREEILPNQLLEVITQSDTTIYVYGNKPVTIIESKSWKVWNTYRSIGIPALVGYQRDKGKFSYGMELGAIYNLLYSFEGMLLDASLTPKLDPEYFKTKINTSLTGGVNLGYKLSQRMSAIAQLSFQHNLSSINNASNPIVQYNSQVGLGVGLQMKL